MEDKKWRAEYLEEGREGMRRYFWKKCLVLFFVLFWLAMLFPVFVRAEGIIAIDANKRYEGMGASFAKGYEPSVKKDTMMLVVPFAAKAKVEGRQIQVGISFEREEDSPFYYKNYQKKVKEDGNGIYLYRCKVKLKKDRVNGQYPLYLLVQAQTEEGMEQQEFTIYVEIRDGRDKASGEGQEGEGEQKAPEGEGGMPVDGGGAFGLEGEGEGNPQEALAGSGAEGEEAAHQPRVMVVQNSFQGEALQAGEASYWTVAVKNCSSRQAIENLKVTLLCESRDITFEKTSWYFEQAGAGQVLDLSQNVTVGRKAAAEAVPVQLQFDYEDKKGTGYNVTESVSLSVKQVQQAELVGLSFPESIYEADTDSLTFQVQNTGLAVIYNVRVRLEGKGLFPEKELFLGNMESGASLDGEIPVFAGTLDMDADGNVIEGGGEKYGDVVGTVIFSYEDEQGVVTEQEQKLQTAIKKPQVVELKIEEEETEKTNQWWITIVALVIGGMALVIVWLYLRMKHYQRMGMAHRREQGLL